MELSIPRVDWEKWTVTLAMLPVCAYFLLVDWDAGGLVGAPWLLAHSLDLIVHEAGHFFFRFFGRTMMIAGGSLLQVLLPGIVAWSALTWGSRAGFQLGMVWLGQSLIDVSVYAADAKARAIPLIGRLGPESHDWYNLLAPIGWLDHAEAVGLAFVVAALIAWGVGLSAPKWTA